MGNNIWYLIKSCISPGDVIPYWSAAGRTKGKSFRVLEVGPNFVVVEAETTGSPLRIPATDFIKVSEVWDAYVQGRVKRYELRDITRFASYIISILHKCLE